MEKYKSLKYIYNNRTKRYTIYIDNVDLIKDGIKHIIGRSASRILIIKDKKTQFDIYSFFLLELEHTLETLKETRPDLAVKIGGIVLNDLMSFLKTKTWLAERNHKSVVNVLDYNNIRSVMKYTLLPHQVEVFKKYEVVKRMANLRGFMMDLGAGQGKMEKNGTPVKTPTGWTNIEKLKVGDKVIGSNGRPTTVTGVFPQGRLPLVRLKFEDNRYSDVGHEHLWSVSVNNKWSVMKTSKIMKYIDKGKDIYIPLIDYKVNKNDVVDEHYIHPYLVGVILASGSKVKCINVTIDKEHDKVKSILPEEYSLYKDINTYHDTHNHRLFYNGKGDCKITKQLKKLNIFNGRDIVPALPASYEHGSYLTRVELLNGILNTSGTNTKGNITYTEVKDIKLANVIKRLAWTLGDIASIRKVIRTTRLGYEYTAYVVKIVKEKIIKITGYTELPEHEATCISVSAKNKLYVTKDYIVTHNTFSSLALGEALSYNNVIVIAPSATIDDVWVKSVTKELYKSPQPYFVLNSKNRDYKKERFLIMSYETLDKVNKDKKLLRMLKRLNPMLIVDEFHNFNNIKALRTFNLMEFVKRVDFQDVVLLTGTPVKMSLNELKPMLYILDDKFKSIVDMYDDFYRGRYEMFRNRFDVYRKHVPKDTKSLPPIKISEYRVQIPDSDRFTLKVINEEIKEFKLKRMEEIMSKMDIYESIYEAALNEVFVSMVTSGIKKGEANKLLSDYRKLVKSIRKFNKDKKLYMAQNDIISAREMEKEIILSNLSSKSKKAFKDVISIIKYPELKVLGEALGKVLLGTRIKCYNELAKHINYKNILLLTDKKGIVFSNYVSTCKVAINKATKDGYKPVGVFGDLVEKLPVSVKAFNDLKDKTNPIVATYKSLSTGVPLVAGNIVILLDTPVRNYLLDQSISRAWRIGQDRPVEVLMVKLDTEGKLNITDRDHYILNMSTQNVEMITGNVNPFEIPQQIMIEDDIVDEEDEAILDMENTVKEELKSSLLNNINSNMVSTDEDNTSVLGNIINKFKFKL